MLLELVLLGDVALRTLGKHAVLIIVGMEVAIKRAAGVAVVLVESAETMVLIDHIIHLQLRRPAFPDVFRLLIAEPLIVIGAYVVEQRVLL